MMSTRLYQLHSPGTHVFTAARPAGGAPALDASADDKYVNQHGKRLETRNGYPSRPATALLDKGQKAKLCILAREAFERVHASRGGLPQYGVNVNYKTLRRLVAAGFVRARQPSPGVCEIDLESYFAHETATIADPLFWTRNQGENAKRLRTAVEGTCYARGAEYCRRHRSKTPEAAS